jgi:ABC-2 type transport system ATP-binding protein
MCGAAGVLTVEGMGDARVVPRIVLSCRNLTKGFGARVAVDGISFDVLSGEAYGLLGPNGAGKTTTLRMVCGLLRPDRGQVSIVGRPIFGPGSREARAALGYVPQGLALLPTLSVEQNLDFWARLSGLPRRVAAERIERTLALVGLQERGRDRVEHCSGGMQRRLNLAIALLHRPRLLILDEPTVGVDAQSRAALLATLTDLRDTGTAIVYTSHYMDEVQRLCDRVGVIDKGRLLVEGSPDTLLAARPDLADLEGLYLELTGRDLRD